MNSTTAFEVRMEASNLPGSLLRSPPPTLGSKRRRALSSPESVRKRPSLLPEPAPTPESLKPLLAESNWHCSNCGIPCWGCFTRPEVTPDLASLNEEKDTNRLRMASAPPTPSEGAYSAQSGTTSPLRNKKKHFLDCGLTYVGPKDKDFETKILDPLGVFIGTARSVKFEPSQIFGSDLSEPKSRVIIKIKEDKLKEFRQDFEEYEERKYDEHTLATICNDSIVLRDRFVSTPFVSQDHNIMTSSSQGPDMTTSVSQDQNMTMSVSQDQDTMTSVSRLKNIRTSVRRDKWKPKKNGPSIPAGGYIYDWDIEPDVTYSVSIRMFDLEHRKELIKDQNHPWLAERFAVSPYLTIEYKCTEKTGKYSDAKHQNTVASILWLHQRKELRQELGLPYDDLKHFSITFIDARFTIWEARFKDDSYYIQYLSRGDLTTIDGLKLYIEWNNAIHSWGLGANADSFKNDILTLFEGRRGQQPFPTPPSTLSPTDAPQQSGAV